MQPQFWLDCWQQEQLGWHLETVHPFLLKAPADWLEQSSVLVPLCGKSLDLHFLAKTAAVVGAELSVIACNDFFRESALAVETATVDDFVCYRAGNIQLWQGDFFQLSADKVATCQGVYDRAALIALPAAMRQAYADKLRQLMPHADMLLISLVYPQAEKNGPPFSVSAEEIRRLFAFAEVSLVDARDLTGQGFARRRFETSALLEMCWRIKW
jgi:thiopurine S-methyltransferase